MVQNTIFLMGCLSGLLYSQGRQKLILLTIPAISK